MTYPRRGDSWAAAGAPFFAGAATTGADGARPFFSAREGSGRVEVTMPCRGLILPPPGGDPYLATISGGAMIDFEPRISVLNVVGTLSSSTQMYSGSLATSPNRGFCTSNHRFSAERWLTDGSPALGRPTSSRTFEHPESSTTVQRTPTLKRLIMRALP